MFSTSPIQRTFAHCRPRSPSLLSRRLATMNRLRLVLPLLTALLALEARVCLAAEPLTVTSDFEGASVRDVVIDEPTRSISFMPGGDPARGWPCWWYFRVSGITPGEPITLRLRGSTSTVEKKKPLASSWAMESLDGPVARGSGTEKTAGHERQRL